MHVSINSFIHSCIHVFDSIYLPARYVDNSQAPYQRLLGKALDCFHKSSIKSSKGHLSSIFKNQNQKLLLLPFCERMKER